MVSAQELVANGTITSYNIDTTVFCFCMMVLDILYKKSHILFHFIFTIANEEDNRGIIIFTFMLFVIS